MSPLTSFGRHDRFGIEILMPCANALCQNLRIRRSRILRIVCLFLVLRLETPVLSAALCKSSRIRRSRILRIVRRFSVLPTPCAKTGKSCAFCDSMPVFLWRDFGGFTKNNKVCVFYWGKICFFSFLSIFCLQEN